jgi:hypothetical protein
MGLVFHVQLSFLATFTRALTRIFSASKTKFVGIGSFTQAHNAIRCLEALHVLQSLQRRTRKVHDGSW